MKLISLINEKFVVDTKIQSEIDELGDLTNKIEQLKKQLQPLQRKYGEVVEKIVPTIEKLNKETLTTNQYVLKIVRKGFQRENFKYKESFKSALSKVNDNTKTILLNILQQTKSLTKINPAFNISPTLGEGIKDKLQVWVIKLMMMINKLGRNFKSIRDGNRLLKRLI